MELNCTSKKHITLMIEEKKTQQYLCWICGSKKIVLVKKSNIQTELLSKSFAITDYNYGTTGNIYRCSECGFLECPELNDVLKYYETLEDFSYDESRKERLIQMKEILKIIIKFKRSGRLLDIGTGTGLLVEEAIKEGFNAFGIEPSKWLYLKAKENNLPVYLGTFPNKDLEGEFDVITLIDIIEHVSNPLALLEDISKALKKDGIIITVTPDIGSLTARLLGWKWWHYRIAHIGYFKKHTIDLAFKKFNFERILFTRPTWFFKLDYLVQRINSYLPKFLNMPSFGFLKRIVIPLNLGDSMLVVYRFKQ